MGDHTTTLICGTRSIASTLPRGSANPRVWQNVGPGARNPAYMQPTSRDKVSFGWAPSQEKLERARQMAGGGSSGGGMWSSPTCPAGYALNRNYSMQELPTSSRFAPVRPTNCTLNTLITDYD